MVKLDAIVVMYKQEMTKNHVFWLFSSIWYSFYCNFMLYGIVKIWPFKTVYVHHFLSYWQTTLNDISTEKIGLQ